MEKRQLIAGILDLFSIGIDVYIRIAYQTADFFSPPGSIGCQRVIRDLCRVLVTVAVAGELSSGLF